MLQKGRIFRGKSPEDRPDSRSHRRMHVVARDKKLELHRGTNAVQA